MLSNGQRLFLRQSEMAAIFLNHNTIHNEELRQITKTVFSMNYCKMQEMFKAAQKLKQYYRITSCCFVIMGSLYGFAWAFTIRKCPHRFVSRGQKERPRLIVPVRSVKTRSVHNKPGRISKYTVRCTLQLFELGGFTGSVVI